MKKIVVLAFVLVAVQSFAQSTNPLDSSAAIFKTYPVLWQQTAAEYRALCYQAFNIARTRLEAIPKRKFRRQHMVIVTDLDETILNNSYSDAQLILDNKDYNSPAWKKWVNSSAGTAVPGAVEFLQWASQRGAHIFYISNREPSDVPATLKNLQNLQLPDADTAHMLFLADGSSKESRRQKVAQQYNIIMLLGDNLNDFTTAFEKKNIQERLLATDEAREDWGNKFIVLPNASYGEWESALYNYKRNLTPAQKRQILMNLLKGTQ